jgi:hypothetical protein
VGATGRPAGGSGSVILYPVKFPVNYESTRVCGSGWPPLKKLLGEGIIGQMDTGSLVLIVSRLLFSAAAAVCAVIIWSKTRDAAWMLIVLGAVSSYVNTVYSILEMFGVTENFFPMIGSVPLATIVISCLPSIFFIAAFCVFLSKRKIKPFV